MVPAEVKMTREKKEGVAVEREKAVLYPLKNPRPYGPLKGRGNEMLFGAA